jgi:hypothetical protein
MKKLKFELLNEKKFDKLSDKVLRQVVAGKGPGGTTQDTFTTTASNPNEGDAPSLDSDAPTS